MYNITFSCEVFEYSFLIVSRVSFHLWILFCFCFIIYYQKFLLIFENKNIVSWSIEEDPCYYTDNPIRTRSWYSTFGRSGNEGVLSVHPIIRGGASEM